MPWVGLQSVVVAFPAHTHLLCNSYTMGCTPIRGDNLRAEASGLSYVYVENMV